MQPRPFRSAVNSTADLPQGGGVGLLEPAESVLCAGTSASLGNVAGRSSTGPNPAAPGWLAFARKLLLSLMGIGAIGGLASVGTLSTVANFTATTVNPSESFTAGTLRMSNSMNAG